MSEVEKLYKNANIEKIKPPICADNEGFCTACICYDTSIDTHCHSSYYQPFTAEKQISIIKWLLESYDIGFSQLGQRIDTSLDGVNCISGLGSGDTFEESLAQAINNLWQDLTDT